MNWRIELLPIAFSTTTFFPRRDGGVRAIRAGFAVPAGPFHAALKKETGERIEQLLQETTTAFR